MPPFGRLASLIVTGPRGPETLAHARALVQAGHRLVERRAEAGRLADGGASESGGRASGKSAFAVELLVLGPAEAPIAVIRGRHRFRILVKAPRTADLQAFLRAMIAEAPKPRGGVRLIVDVDPQSFL
jgi:primosomal protein N' (replication factor Y)